MRRTVIALVEMIAIGRNLYLVPDIAPKKHTPHSSNHPQNVVVCLLAPLLFLLLLLFVVRQHSHQKLILLQLFFFYFSSASSRQNLHFEYFSCRELCPNYWIFSSISGRHFTLFGLAPQVYVLLLLLSLYPQDLSQSDLRYFFRIFSTSDHFRLLLRIFRCSLYFCLFFFIWVLLSSRTFH